MSDSTNGAEVQAMKAAAFTSVKPMLYVEAPKANEAVQFFKAAFGAEEVKREVNPKRKADQKQPLVVAVELKIGGVSFLVADLTEDVIAGLESSVHKGSVIRLETETVDAAVTKAVAAGAVAKATPNDGEPALADGGLVPKLYDPYGNLWIISLPRKLEPYDVQPESLV